MSPPTRQRRPDPDLAPRGGFTLIELMISIAIVLALIIGVNEVFSMTSRTVAAGQALGDIQRDNRTTLQTLSDDFHGMAVSDGPFIVIRSQAQYAFRNANDRLADADGNAATFDNGSGTEATVPLYALSPRTHRIDSIRFFSRGLFHRQTGNDGTYAANMACNEACIWYGHLNRPGPFSSNSPNSNPWLQPNNFVGPGVLPNNDIKQNPNNYYTNQWVLGRACMLLAEPNSQGQITDLNGTSQSYYVGPSLPADPNAPLPLPIRFDPFQFNTQGGPSYGKTPLAFWSRYDLAGTSIDGYRRYLSRALNPPNNPKNPYWWDAVSNFRYNGDLTPPRPLASDGAALTVPAFVAGCTQFAVEFAGDFCAQDNNGAFTSLGPDGQIDYLLVPDPASPAQKIRKIRWYGFPRDTNDDGNVDGSDVIPFANFAGTAANFELPGKTTPTATPIPANTPKAGDTYLVAWGPQDTVRPSMIRITMTVDDTTPNAARISAGQTFEYVFRLQ